MAKLLDPLPPRLIRFLTQRLRGRWPLWGVALVILVAAGIAAYEMIASPFQATVLANYGKTLTWTLEDGPSKQIHFPTTGPYDIRLGYTQIPHFTKRLLERGYTLTKQARISDQMQQVGALGLFLPFNEKSVVGVTLRGCRNEMLFALPQPRQSYATFEQIPPVIANTLLYIENRELLDPNHPQRNPAVEWDRFAQAVLEKGIQLVQPGRNVPGGSTLATQIEKYRHSPDGLTLSGSDKLKQMASASLRAYLDGTDTRVTRQRLVQAYLNTVPLSAAPGHGEVIGLADALNAWFGLDFADVNRQLLGTNTAAAGRAYKHVLALLIAQRRPSHYLLSNRAQLEEQANTHLKLLAKANIIPGALRDLALAEKIQFRKTESKTDKGLTFVEHKAANALRTEITRNLGLAQLYDLDRLDLNVDTTLHASAQHAVTQHLKRLTHPEAIKANGMYGHYLLAPKDDLTKIIYSFTLNELTPEGAAVRIQADNLNQPFDINQGAKLDMGSSAKLRTLITYLELVAELHAQYAAQKPAELAKVEIPRKDVLTAWVINYLRSPGDHSLPATLRAAMERKYSASPGEGFYTGGGLHYFNNFHREDDHKVMDLWEATRNSVNLPFIRLMRDIIHHLTYRAPSTAARVLADADNAQRQTYLVKFADNEGRAFLARFHKKYRGLSPEQISDNLLNHLTAHPRRLAAVFRYLEPQADLASFAQLMRNRLANPKNFSDKDLASLFEVYGPNKFNLADRGYITQIHPLELWLAAYLRKHPQAKWDELIKASAEQRVEVYDWLFRTSRKNTQDNRIQSLLEIEAFQELHKRWVRLGYPFNILVPSYATAIGSSADRPAALAELMGVIRNDGVKLPSVTLRQLEFAANTPYHTVFKHKIPASERIFSSAVAQILRSALRNVVQDGTARRIRGAFPLGTNAEGKPTEVSIGGKTGTGDHRLQIFAAGGGVIAEKVMNRVATFAFFIGERHFGVITAFVPGEPAKNYQFTSALPVQLLKSMAPILRPLVVSSEHLDPPWEDLVQAFEAEAAVETGAKTAPATQTPAAASPAPVTPPVAATPAKTVAPTVAATPRPAKPAPRADTKPAPKTSSVAKPETRSTGKVKPETRPEAKPDPKSSLKPASQPAATAETRPQTHATPPSTPQPNPYPKPEPTPNAKPAQARDDSTLKLRIEAERDAPSGAVAESKPEPKPEPAKPAAPAKPSQPGNFFFDNWF